METPSGDAKKFLFGMSPETAERNQALGKAMADLMESAQGDSSKIGNLAFSSRCGKKHEQAGLVSFSGHEEKVFFHNLGGGKFVEIGGAIGVANEQDGRGLVAADLDGCGAVDLLMGMAYKPPLIALRNEVGTEKNMLTVRLRSPGKNRFAIGARVLYEGEGTKRAQEVECGGSYLSCNPTELYFGLGDAKTAKKLTVRWPSGQTSTYSDVPAGIVTITEGQEGDAGLKHEPYRKRPKKVEPRLARLLRRGDAFDLRLQGLSGSVLEPGALKEKWTVIEVWSAACSSCQCEIKLWPDLTAAVDKRGARLIALNVDDDPAKAQELAKASAPPFEVWRADNALGAILSPYEPLVPATIIVGPDGKVAARATGVLSQKELEDLLDAAAKR